MLLFRFLKINLKKSKQKRKRTSLFLFFVWIVAEAGAITTHTEIRTEPDLTIIQTINNSDNGVSILNSLENGYQSRVLIQVRLYKKKPHSFFSRGDELVKSLEISKDAVIDIFSKNYKLSFNNESSYYESKVDFLENFLSEEFFLPLVIQENRDYYLKIRTTLINKLYLKPFNIMYLFNFKNKYTTDWKVLSLFQDKG